MQLEPVFFCKYCTKRKTCNSDYRSIGECDHGENDKNIIIGVDLKDLSEEILRNSEKTSKVCRRSHIEANYQKLKEEKVEKKIIRDWEDIQECMIGRMHSIGKDGKKIAKLKYSDVIFEVLEKQLDKAIKILNSLGGNFEYKPISKVVDWDNLKRFLTKIGADGFCYNFYEERFITTSKSFTIEGIEEKYNVDLSCLK